MFGFVYIISVWEELGNIEFEILWDKKKDTCSGKLDIGVWSIRDKFELIVKIWEVYVNWYRVIKVFIANDIIRKSEEVFWFFEISLFFGFFFNIKVVF